MLLVPQYPIVVVRVPGEPAANVLILFPYEAGFRKLTGGKPPADLQKDESKNDPSQSHTDNNPGAKLDPKPDCAHINTQTRGEEKMFSFGSAYYSLSKEAKLGTRVVRSRICDHAP
jgi:hypothetical protein